MDEILHHNLHPVTALRRACEAIRQHWPECIVEYLSDLPDLHEVFVFQNAEAKASMDDPDEDETFAPTMIHLLTQKFSSDELTVVHEDQNLIFQAIRNAIAK